MLVSTAVRVREPSGPQPAVTARPLLRDVSRDVASCTVCTLRRICMPVDIQDAEARKLFERLVTTRIRLRKGDVLFRAGDRFTALFAVRVGSLKTVTLTDDGSEQVSGYHLAGEIVGVEGVGNDVHACQAVALEDTEVCTLPFDRVEQLARDDASFQRRLYRLLSSAIVRERTVALVVGTMSAEQRLASFLVDLSNRYHARGYSPTEFVLRMTREEIGSHLGLKLETVSRIFSRFAEERLIVVSGRVIKLLDRAALHRLVAAS
ncbi:MAG TPA: helix-turn-helix domain-containing protein [Casimicrobiaceae bacterium]|nr:helix-turn-helix domain-containing protein [Casimicrobiaceae bacterium]